MAEHNRDPNLGAEVRQPIPGEHTFNGHGEIVPIGRHDLEQRLRAGVEMAVDHDCTISVQEADLHHSRMQVDAAVMVMRFGVEAPEVSSSFASVSPTPAVPRGYAEEGTSISIIRMEPTRYPLAPLSFFVRPSQSYARLGQGFRRL
jgi:hypothetical protein